MPKLKSSKTGAGGIREGYFSYIAGWLNIHNRTPVGTRNGRRCASFRIDLDRPRVSTFGEGRRIIRSAGGYKYTSQSQNAHLADSVRIGEGFLFFVFKKLTRCT